MNAIDNVFRPLDPNEYDHRDKPMSIKKLRQVIANWDTTKKILGWVLNTKDMKIHLPQRHIDCLATILQSIAPNQRCL